MHASCGEQELITLPESNNATCATSGTGTDNPSRCC